MTSPIPATMTRAFAERLNEVLAAPKGRPSLFEAGEPFGEIAFNLETRRSCGTAARPCPALPEAARRGPSWP